MQMASIRRSVKERYNRFASSQDNNDFKSKFPFEKRKSEADRIMKKYPDRIPVIVEKRGSSDIATIDKNKYLVPKDITVGQFVYVIRKRIKLTPEQAIFIFVNNTLPATSQQISEVYQEHKDSDGFVYLEYSGESTFGGKTIENIDVISSS